MKSHFLTLKAELEERPYLVCDAATGSVLLATKEQAIDLASRGPKGKHFQSCLVMDARQALLRFAALVGRMDRVFSVDELAVIGGVGYSVCDYWFERGVLTPDGAGSSKRERRCSWRMAYVAGVTGNLRRQGLPVETIKIAADMIRAIGAIEPAVQTAEAV